MYADRTPSVRPLSLVAAVGINAALVAGLILASPQMRGRIGPTILTTTNVPIAPPPPPEITPPLPRTSTVPPRPSPPIPPDMTRPPVSDTTTAYVLPPLPLPALTGQPDGTGTGSGPIAEPVPSLPMLIGASADPRYARDFQPDYPAAERRAQTEGVVVIRVLIGVDGRVRRAERISAASDAFWRVTERQALSRWRFRPATRDGIPEEAWKQISVRFRMDVS